MPLSINVGLSRKASKDYQSSGTSISITAELDQSLLAKPQELQRQIEDLYSQAEEAIERRIEAHPGNRPPEPPEPPAPRNRPEQPAGSRSSNGGRNGNGRGENHGRASTGMTDSQRKAIEAIAGRLDLNPVEEVRHVFGWELDRLSVREASKVIDHLKSVQPAHENDNSPRNGGGR